MRFLVLPGGLPGLLRAGCWGGGWRGVEVPLGPVKGLAILRLLFSGETSSELSDIDMWLLDRSVSELLLLLPVEFRFSFSQKEGVEVTLVSSLSGMRMFSILSSCLCCPLFNADVLGMDIPVPMYGCKVILLSIVPKNFSGDFALVMLVCDAGRCGML